MTTYDVVPIIADDLRTAVDYDPIHRHSGGDRPVPSRIGFLTQGINAIAEDVQHGSVGMKGGIG
jgi:hypothetical protein